MIAEPTAKQKAEAFFEPDQVECVRSSEAEAVKHFLKPVVAVPHVLAGDAVAGAGAAAERVPYRDRVNQREQAQRVEGQEAARYEDVSYIQATGATNGSLVFISFPI